MDLGELSNCCIDCDKDIYQNPKDYYMIRNDLWKKYGVGKGMLCIECIEKRLGRKICKEDLTDCLVNTIFNPYTIMILSEK